jgi:hypothetical protein
MKTKTYTVVYGEDAPCYAIHSFEASHDGEAIAIALAHDWESVTTDPDWDSASNRRIVNIEDGCRLVASDIPLDMDSGQVTDRRLRDSALDLYNALTCARVELERIFRSDCSEILRVVNAALDKAGGRSP